MDLSIIIPAYNEEDGIAHTILEIKKRSGQKGCSEIIVVDGGSTDRTQVVAAEAGARVVCSPRKGRAPQMNTGAERAKGDIFYFLHADTIPPYRFDEMIINNVRRQNPAGCFRLSFDDDHFLLDFYSWLTRFDFDAFRFGDQSLFVTRSLFQQVGGFREDHAVMEDNEIVRRIKKEASFSVLVDAVTTSARKYRKIGLLKLQLVFILIFFLYHTGYSQEGLIALYQKFIHVSAT